MNRFVHGKMHHFLQDATDGEGNDLGGGADGDDDQDESDELGEDDQAGEDDEADDAGEVVVTIGDEKPAEDDDDIDGKPAPKWVKDVRLANREKDKRIRELEAQLKKSEPAPQVPVLGKKPTMDDADIDYDADKFEEKLTAWHDRKREIEQAQTEQQKQQAKQQEEWQGRLTAYATSKTGLKVKDFDDAEDSVKGILDETQHAIIVQAAKNPALMVYAIGKNPKKAAELAAIKNYVEFAYALGELSKEMKVTARKAPPPEKTISGTGKMSGSVDSNLERLRAEAEKTGDMTKVNAYRREQKRKQKN